MDTLILKIICAAIALVLFASFHRSGSGDSMNDTHEQSTVNPAPGKSDETHESSHHGTRADIKPLMDNSANSESHIDSNPK